MASDHHLKHEEEERKDKEDELQLLAIAAENKFLMKIMAQSILKTDKVEDLFVDPAKDFKFMIDLNNTNT
jgi:hypothetical protein